MSSNGILAGRAPSILRNDRRILLVLGSLTCALAYQVAYEAFLFRFFDYYNYAYHAHSIFALAVAYAVAVVPSACLKQRLVRPTQLLYWLLYVMVYIPSILTPLFIAPRLTTDIWLLLAALAVGFIGLGLVHRLPLLRLPEVRLTPAFCWSILGGLLITGALVAWRTYAGHLRLVNFLFGYAEVSEHRLETRDIGAAAGVLQYLLDALASAIDPMLLSYALLARKRWLFLVATAAQILLYATAGMKSILLSVPLTVLLYVLLCSRRGIPAVLAWGTGVLLLASTAIGVWGGLPGLMLGSLVILRTFGTPGLSTSIYSTFFATHAVTLGSHLHGLSALIHYPYHTTIPYVIGSYYWNNPDLSANANFWAQDGLAGFGCPGILIVSAAAMVLFWIVDSASAHLPTRFAALALSFQAVNLANGSLFTILLTNGFALQIILLYMWPHADAPTFAVPPRRKEPSAPRFAGVPSWRGPS